MRNIFNGFGQVSFWLVFAFGLLRVMGCGTRITTFNPYDDESVHATITEIQNAHKAAQFEMRMSPK